MERDQVTAPDHADEIASGLVDEWERIEGESMREGHRATLERLIVAALRERDEEGYQRGVEAIMDQVVPETTRGEYE